MNYGEKLEKLRHPLMQNNFTREDLNLVIEHLKKNDPKLTQGEQVVNF